MSPGRFAALIAFILLLPDQARAQNVDGDPTAVDQPYNLVKVLRTTNKAQTNRYVPKVYTFEHVNPYATMRQIRRVMQIEESAWFCFASPELDSGKMLLIVPEYQIPGLDRLVEVLDVPGMTSSAGSKKLYYRIKHRDATDVAAALTVELQGTPTAELQADTFTNSWFVKDAPSGMARMVGTVETEVDLPTPQVEALLTVYEVDVSDDGQLGLDYISWKNGPGRNLFAVGAYAQKEKVSQLSNPAALIFDSGKNTYNLPGDTFESSGRNGAYFYDVPSAFFDFLVSKGRARIMTSSRLVALNNSTASLTIGEKILYYDVKDDGDARAGARLLPLDPYGDLDDTTDPVLADDFHVLVVDYPDNRVVVPATEDRALGSVTSGFFFNFTPSIHTENTTVALNMSLVNLTGWAGDGKPVLGSRVIDTKFEIPNDGRALTIGGMTRKRRVDSANKMPWLGDIPILGYLFGGESRLDQKTSVFATVTMRVAEAGADNRTEEDTAVMERVNGNRPTPVEPNDPGFIRK